jgi:hypothetical protein
MADPVHMATSKRLLLNGLTIVSLAVVGLASAAWIGSEIAAERIDWVPRELDPQTVGRHLEFTMNRGGLYLEVNRMSVDVVDATTSPASRLRLLLIPADRRSGRSASDRGEILHCIPILVRDPRGTPCALGQIGHALGVQPAAQTWLLPGVRLRPPCHAGTLPGVWDLGRVYEGRGTTGRLM